MHSYPYLLSDVPKYDFWGNQIPGSAYGWVNNQQKVTAESIVNADSYMLLALWAYLGDSGRMDVEHAGNIMRGGFTLARDPGLEYPLYQEQAHQAAVDGKLVCYYDITE